MLVIGGMGSSTDRTPARTTARGKATTPPKTSSCLENLTDTTATSTNTCGRGDSGRTPDAEKGAGRKVSIYSNRIQATRVRVGVGATRRSNRQRRRQDTDPCPVGTRTASPEYVATGTGIILRSGAAEAGSRASVRCHRLIFRGILRRRFRLICRLDNFPTHRGTLSRQNIPTRTNTWDTRGGGQQRGTGHHHRRRSWGLPSSSSSTTTNNNSKRARFLPRLPLPLHISLLQLLAQLKPAELPCSSSSHAV